MNQAALASLARPSSRSLLLGPCARQGRLVLLAQGRPTGQPTGKPQRCLEFACISSRCHVCVYARASVCVEGGRGVAASSDRGPRGPRPAGAAPETAPRHPARSAWSAAAPSVSRAAAGAVPVASGGRSRAGLRRSRRSLRRSLPTKRGRGADAGCSGDPGSNRGRTGGGSASARQYPVKTFDGDLRQQCAHSPARAATPPGPQVGHPWDRFQRIAPGPHPGP